MHTYIQSGGWADGGTYRRTNRQTEARHDLAPEVSGTEAEEEAEEAAEATALRSANTLEANAKTKSVAEALAPTPRSV